MKDIPINKGMFKNSRRDHEVTSENISPRSRGLKLTKSQLIGKEQFWVLKEKKTNTRKNEYLKIVNNGCKKSNKESKKPIKNKVVKFAQKNASVDIHTAKKTVSR